MRIVLEMTKNADPEVILRDLYKRTPMQTTFSINLLALVDGEPHPHAQAGAARLYVEHRLTVIKRRAEFDLERAKQRAHILEGYLVALKNLDEVINIIRGTQTWTRRGKLMKRFKLTEMQASAHPRPAIAQTRRPGTQEDRDRNTGKSPRSSRIWKTC